MLWPGPRRTRYVGYRGGLTTVKPPVIRGGETAEEEMSVEAEVEEQ